MRLSAVTRLGAFLAGGMLLAHCAGSSQPSLPPTGVALTTQSRQASNTEAKRHRPASWMRPDAQDIDLLYVSNANGFVNVYRFWQHTLVGVLTNFTQPRGACSDASGNVYIVDHEAEKIYEYAHGGTKPIKTLDDSPQMPDGCAVDRSTGNLAVANDPYGYYSKGNIAVYVHAMGKPKIYYGTSYNDHFIDCVYDDRGDLFTATVYGYLSFYTEFFYLPKHGSQLLLMNMPGGDSSGWGYIQSVAWDGKYWIIGMDNILYLFTINIKAKYISSITLGAGYGVVNQISFYRKSPTARATLVVGGSSSNSYKKSVVQYWKYPAGGSPIYGITKDLDIPFGTAISLGPQ
jgi:hypothetical protein